MSGPAAHHEHHPLEEAAAETLAGIGRRAALLRLAVLAALVIGAFAAVLLTGGISSGRVRDWVDGFGDAAPIAFVATSALLTVSFFPGPLLAASAGVLFGTAAGFPLAMVSALLGGCLAFTISRTVGHDAVEHLQGPRLRRLRDWVGSRGFVSVLTARLLPGVPYNSVNYAAGLTPVPLAAFAAATAIGTAPRTYAYVAVGGEWGDWTSPRMLVAIGLLAATGAAGVIVARRRRPDVSGATPPRRSASGSGTGSSTPAGPTAGRR